MINQIMFLVTQAMRVNQYTKHDVFVQISPHINNVSIELYIGGWNHQEKPDTRFWLGYNEEGFNDDDFSKAMFYLRSLEEENVDPYEIPSMESLEEKLGFIEVPDDYGAHKELYGKGE